MGIRWTCATSKISGRPQKCQFLTERRQRVKLGSTMSEWVQIHGGVPQGTLLGPTGFLVHINDLQTVCNTCKYVDDSSVLVHGLDLEI